MKSSALLACAALAGAALAQAPAELSPQSFARGQSIADEMANAASVDVAFMAEGLLRQTGRGDLASLLEYPGDEIVVMKLSGSQIKAALERSISLFPSPNPAFLHVSGLEVTYNPSLQPDARVTEVTLGGSALSNGSTHEVAMPSSLARGGLGYFTLWEKKDQVRTLEGQTLESLLKGKRSVSSSPRWTSRG